MSDTWLKGSCACGNITYQCKLSKPTETYHPRACDCEFCTKHMAAYISDPNGEIRIHIQQATQLNRYRQGTRLAEFLICQHCGVLTNVLYINAQGQTIASINSRTLDTNVTFAALTPVSPQTLTDPERIARWPTTWFNRVTLSFNAISEEK